MSYLTMAMCTSDWGWLTSSARRNKSSLLQEVGPMVHTILVLRICPSSIGSLHMHDGRVWASSCRHRIWAVIALCWEVLARTCPQVPRELAGCSRW